MTRASLTLAAQGCPCDRKSIPDGGLYVSRSLAAASCLLVLLMHGATAASDDTAKGKANAAMTAFQFCAAGKIATLGKSESSEFLVEAATEACQQEAEEATDSFFSYAKAEMHATSSQRGVIATMYAKELHTRVVQLVIAFKSNN